MSIYSINNRGQVSIDSERSCYCYESTVCKAAYLLYRKVERRAKLRKLFCKLFGRCYTLQNLSQVFDQCDESKQFSSENRAVELKNIHGSESCCEDFDVKFNPLNLRKRERWIYIADQYLRGYALPPVDLIQVGDEYYVRDGHQRISVMHSLGYDRVDARVMVLQMVNPRHGRGWIKELAFD
jgi:hypothetical protein